MDGNPVTLLIFGTFGVVLVIAVLLLARFLRKPQNRHSMDGEPERNIDQIRAEASPAQQVQTTAQGHDKPH